MVATRPDIWAKYACPCPIRESDLASNRKSMLQQKARTHARIRLLQPLLSQFVAHVGSRREESERLLDTALRCGEGDSFEIDGGRYKRVKNIASDRKRRDTIAPVMIRRIDQSSETRTINCRIKETVPSGLGLSRRYCG